MGKAFLYALASGGQAGVALGIDIMRRELSISMALAGATDVSRKWIARCCGNSRMNEDSRRQSMEEVVIVAALRTAVGKFGGSLAKVPAADLGAQVIKALLSASGIAPDQISEVLMGQVLTAGCGQNPGPTGLRSAPACPIACRR